MAFDDKGPLTPRTSGGAWMPAMRRVMLAFWAAASARVKQRGYVRSPSSSGTPASSSNVASTSMGQLYRIERARASKALYGTVVGEASRFSKSLDQADLANVKTAGLQLLLATGIDAMPSALPNRQCHHVTCLSSRHPVNLVTSTRSDATSGGFLPPTNPSPPNKEIEDAAMKLADALYPLVSQLKSKEVGPLATKAVGLAITGNPTEIIRTIDAGLDAFITVPPAKVTSQLTCGG